MINENHKEMIKMFFEKFDETRETARALHIVTGEMDFLAIDVLMNTLQTAMLNGDLPELTETIAKFAISKCKDGDNAIDDLIDDTINKRGVN
jgi:hypothetical protein